ncbi:MAG: hypothetical protein ACI9MR_001028, partial [Myxococcota bacterium]
APLVVPDAVVAVTQQHLNFTDQLGLDRHGASSTRQM